MFNCSKSCCRMMVISSGYFDLRPSDSFTPSAWVRNVILTGRCSEASGSVSAILARAVGRLHGSANAGEAGMRIARKNKHCRTGDDHTPHLRGIQYAATCRVHHCCLWNTRSPARSGRMTTGVCSRCRGSLHPVMLTGSLKKERGRRECRIAGRLAARAHWQQATGWSRGAMVNRKAGRADKVRLRGVNNRCRTTCSRRADTALTNRAIRACTCYIWSTVARQAWRRATNLRTGRFAATASL